MDHAVRTAGGACDEVVVVLPPGHQWDGPPVAAVVDGGARRSDSVRNGLEAVPAAAEIVVVHDAARPLASPDLFQAVVAAVAAGADAAVPVLPVVDTLKRVRDDEVVETVDRSDLVAVQTPQAFRAEVLRRAHERGADATDDAALVEVSGGTVRVVPGDQRNVKLTTAVDLEVAAALTGVGPT